LTRAEQISGATPANSSAAADAGRKTWDLYSGPQRWTYLWVLFLVCTSNYVDRNIITVLVEPIKIEFGASDAMMGLLTGLAFAMFYATLGIPVAQMADRGNRKHVIAIALTVWSVMTTLSGLAQNFWHLALARVGVGAGEAGAIPPAQSLIADYFRPELRARALGVFMMAAMAGYVLGLVLGGYIAEHYGWRAAFLIVGPPGLALALVVHFVLKEPRLKPEFAIPKEARERAWDAFRALARTPSYVLIILGLVFYFLVAYGALVFSVSFMMRVHGMSVSEAGGAYGLVSSVGAVIGTLAGATLTDLLSKKRGLPWAALVPGISLIISLPLQSAAFLADSVLAMMTLVLLANCLFSAAVPAMFAALHLVCGSKRRATAVAVALFFANLFGLGLGPPITGVLSDMFAGAYGPGEGLRYALLIMCIALAPAGFFMLRAAKHLEADLEV
jgi:predicted MFS family arabinose efflux permease